MKKRISILGSAMLILTILGFCLASYYVTKQDYIVQTEANLRTVYNYFEAQIHNFSRDDTGPTLDGTNPNAIRVQNPAFESLMQTTIDSHKNLNMNELRITIIDLEGSVLADSDFETEDLNFHRSRPEVYAIIQGQQEATAVRESGTQDTEVLYMAFKSPNDDFIIRVSSKMDYLLRARSNFLKIGVFAGALSLLIFQLFLHIFFRQDKKTFVSYQESLKKISQGDLSTRLYENPFSSVNLKKFSRSFNDSMVTIEKKYREIEDNKIWLEVMVNALDEPLVVVNQELNIIYTNRYARILFNRHIDPKKTPYPFVLLTHETELDDLVLKVLRTGQPLRKEYRLQVVGSSKLFQVIMSPIDTKHIIVLFHDLSLEYEARELRSSFVANVTHELKTPLTSIRGFVETLRNHSETTTQTQTENFLSIIDVEAERLERLIDDILKLSDIERLEADHHVSNFDIIELLDECLVQLDDQAMSKKISIIPNEEPIFLQVKANRDRIKQVFLNLLDNAIKYNRDGGKVWIDITKEEEYVVIKVKDTGYGFDTTSAKRVFERFYRVDKSRSRELGGTGLGLSIVKHIALLYEGEAQVDSEPEKGTTFTIKLKI